MMTDPPNRLLTNLPRDYIFPEGAKPKNKRPRRARPIGGKATMESDRPVYSSKTSTNLDHVPDIEVTFG